MTKFKLTDLEVKNLKPRNSHYSLSDGNGLYLRVYPNKRKQWMLRKTSFGRATMVPLGDYPKLSIANARKAAFKASEQFLDGRKHRGETRVLFKTVVSMWVQAREVTQSTLQADSYALKTWECFSEREIKDISPIEARSVIEHHIQKGEIVTAKRKLSLLSQIERYALALGLIDTPKLQYIVKTLPKAVVKHRRSIPAERLGEVFQLMAERKVPPTPDEVDTVKAICLTLGRISEVLSMQYDWVDYDEMIITFPPEVMKAKREHRVPISPQLEKLLRRRWTRAGGYVFPSAVSKDGHACRNIFIHRGKVGKLITPHGFRSMGRSWMALKGYDFAASEYCLAHKSENRTQRAYQRYDYLEQRRVIMRDWGAWVEECYKPYYPD